MALIGAGEHSSHRLVDNDLFTTLNLSTMKAAYITQLGPPDVIIYGELPHQTPGIRQCLVRIRAASLNPIDIYIRSGLVSMPISFPFVVGCDFAGTIVQVGPGVERFRVGDRVWGSNQGLLGRQGVSSEYGTIDECWLYPAPATVGDQALAAMALVGITSHLGLVREAALKPGETLLVHGAGGAIGSTVVQFGKTLGARVIASAGSEEKAERCLKLGADAAFCYRSADVARTVQQLAPQGVNVWWQAGRIPDFDLAIGCLAARGRMILMAGRDARPHFPVGPFYVKGCSLHGFAMFAATPDEQRQAAEQISQWLEAGKVSPVIDRVLPLSQVAEAHRLQEQSTLQEGGALMGKIVLEI
jgi:NADPH:quinone reductase